ncbi:MAG: DUF1206 domain-containing protein [Aeromicrobium sp.]
MRASGQDVKHNDMLKRGARIGLVAYGVVHLLVAWIALQIAWSGGGDASTGGALKTLVEQPFGKTMLWITVLGLVALLLWQLATAVWGFQSEDEPKKSLKRASAVGRAVLYGVLAFSAFKIVTGSGSSSGGDSKEEGLTADLLGAPAGRVLVILVGLAIVVVAVMMIRRGVTDGFTHDLEGRATSGQSGSTVLWLGRFGYVAKGIAVGVVGILFGWSALSYDPEKAGGLDDALKTVRDQPFGPYLLTFVALGIAAFGLFCFAWSKYARTR